MTPARSIVHGLSTVVMSLATATAASAKSPATTVPSVPSEGTASSGQSASAVPKAAGRTEVVERFFAIGLDAQAHGDLEAAHQSFLAAWNLAHTGPIAGSLGLIEVQLGEYISAAEHLTFALSQARDENVRQALADGLSKAQRFVATVQLSGLPEGARLDADSRILGRAPFPFAVYLNPGTYVFQAQKDGYATRRVTKTVAAGETVGLELAMLPDLVPPSGSTKAATPETVMVQPLNEKHRGLSFPPPRWLVLYSGITLTVAAAAVGTAFLIGRSNARHRLDELHGQLDERYQNSDSICRYLKDPACSALQPESDKYVSSGTGAVIALSGAGALGIATALTFALWPKSPGASASKTAASEDPSFSLSFLPIAGGGQLVLGTHGGLL